MVIGSVENQAWLPSTGAWGCLAHFTRVLAEGMLFLAAIGSGSSALYSPQNMPIKEHDTDIIPTAAHSITTGQYRASLDITLQ